MNATLALLVKNVCDVGRPPQRVETHKHYMRTSPYKEKIAAMFDERWPTANLEPNFRLWYRTTLAKQLFEAEDEEIRNKITMEAEAEYEENIKAYKELMSADRIATSKVEEFGDLAKHM
jgi:hypothetical protein